MDPVKFWGVVFRSGKHLQWFQRSVIYFLFIGALCLLSRLVVLPQSLNDVIKGSFLAGGVAVYLIVSLSAAIKTRWGKHNGPVYSVDCIWFNALLGAVYLILLFIV